MYLSEKSKLVYSQVLVKALYNQLYNAYTYNSCFVDENRINENKFSVIRWDDRYTYPKSWDVI